MTGCDVLAASQVYTESVLISLILHVHQSHVELDGKAAEPNLTSEMKDGWDGALHLAAVGLERTGGEKE